MLRPLFAALSVLGFAACGGPPCPYGYVVDPTLGYCVSADAGLDGGDAAYGDLGADAGADAGPLDASDDAGDLGASDAGLVFDVGPRLVSTYGTTCVARRTGDVDCWGYDQKGAVGDGQPSQPDPLHVHDIPVPVHITVSAAAESLSLGESLGCARLRAGGLECWGSADGVLWSDSLNHTIPTPTIVDPSTRLIAAEQFARCSLDPSGVKCWGLYGFLGDGHAFMPPDGGPPPRSDVPVALSIPDPADVQAGGLFACARRASGTVACWGYNARGSLGDGTVSDRVDVVSVVALADVRLVRLGGLSACAVVGASGAVLCWGGNEGGEVGRPPMDAGVPLPSGIAGLGHAAVDVGVSDTHACAALADGTVWCWGDNSSGQLGNGGTTGSVSPVQAFGVMNVVEVSVGHGFTCALDTADSVKCWGKNEHGQLGDTTFVDRHMPITVHLP